MHTHTRTHLKIESCFQVIFECMYVKWGFNRVANLFGRRGFVMCHDIFCQPGFIKECVIEEQRKWMVTHGNEDDKVGGGAEGECHLSIQHCNLPSYLRRYSSKSVTNI